MKRLKQALTTGLLCSAFLLNFATPTQAAEGFMISHSIVEDSIRQLDIMKGDEAGDLQLGSYVSRAEFATMLVAASPFKNASTHFGYTLFPDVPSNYWASGYIKVVVEHGYMVGYLDGNFGPTQPVLLEEAVTAVLNLLGYDSSTLVGTYPQAQLAKYFELDLDEFMSVNQGTMMTREQCMYLFYNLMNTDHISGSPYASQMGYSTTATGDLDSIALTTKNTQGPFLVGKSSLPDSVASINRIYRNDKEASLDQMEHYDVLYYNSKLSTLWMYSEKVTGRLTTISSQQSPTSVTVAGQTYQLETTDVKHKFSVGGEFREGDMVTLLLGNNSMVADVVSASNTDGTVVGVVLGRGIEQLESGEGNLMTSNYIQMITTEGVLFEFDSGGKYYDAGRVIEVTYTGGVQSSKGITTRSISGKMNSNSTAIGSHKLAEDVQLFEISEGSSTYERVFASRLAGYTIKEEDVRYYTTNQNGEIDSIIFEDVTGDLATYTLLTKVSEVNSGMNLIGQYTYLHHGTPGFEMTDTRVFDLSKGGSVFFYDEGDLDYIKNLEQGEISYSNALEAHVNGKTYPLADTIQVYEIYNHMYQTVALKDVSDLSRYKLTAYYDQDLFSAGGQIRIILAEAIK